MELSDQDFALLQKQDKEVLTRIYNHYSERVTTYFYVRTFGNHATADDLTQETFFAFIEYAPRLKSPKHIQPSIFTIARNKLADYQRRLYRDKEKKKLLIERVEIEEDVINEIHNRQKALLFSMALDTLRKRDREVYEMHYVKEKEIAEIAAYFNKTYKSIDGILCRMREKLKKTMAAIAYDFFEGGEKR